MLKIVNDAFKKIIKMVWAELSSGPQGAEARAGKTGGETGASLICPQPPRRGEDTAPYLRREMVAE